MLPRRPGLGHDNDATAARHGRVAWLAKRPIHCHARQAYPRTVVDDAILLQSSDRTFTEACRSG